MNPVIFQFGPLSLRWYGVFIVGGAVLAAWVSSRYAKRAGENPDHIWNLLAFALIGGIIGARLYHVFSSPADGLGWAYYREHPVDIFNFWSGGFRGLGIYGGLIGGILAIVGYCLYNKLSILRYLDFIAPNVLLAQAMGRMGNFVNQELYGPPTTLPWAFHINPNYLCQLPALPEGIQPCGSPNLTEASLAWYANNGFHPTFFYEALWSLGAWVAVTLIIWFYGERLRRGSGLLLYFTAYPLGRFWVEAFRPDAWVMGSMATAQWISILLIIACVAIFIVRQWGWDWREHPEASLREMSRLNRGVVQPVTTATQP